MYENEMGMFTGIIAGMGIFAFLIAAVFYVLKSIGLATLAANKGIENAWLAWIPVADLYIAGAILEEMDLFGIHIDNLGLWYPVIMIAGGILANIPVLGVLIAIALAIFGIAFCYFLFKKYTENAVLFTVLSVLLGLWPIFIFVVRNNKVLDQEIITA